MKQDIVYLVIGKQAAEEVKTRGFRPDMYKPGYTSQHSHGLYDSTRPATLTYKSRAKAILNGMNQFANPEEAVLLTLKLPAKSKGYTVTRDKSILAVVSNIPSNAIVQELPFAEAINEEQA